VITAIAKHYSARESTVQDKKTGADDPGHCRQTRQCGWNKMASAVLLVTISWIFMYENSSLFVRALVTFFDWVAYSMKLGSLPVSLAEFIENVCIGK
jgi:hypothetical protein